MLVCLIINSLQGEPEQSNHPISSWTTWASPSGTEVSSCLWQYWIKALVLSQAYTLIKWLMTSPLVSIKEHLHTSSWPQRPWEYAEILVTIFIFVLGLCSSCSITFHYSGPLTYWKINSFCWSKVVCLCFINWSVGQAAVLGGETGANGSAEVARGTKTGLWRVAIRQATSTLFVRTQE